MATGFIAKTPTGQVTTLKRNGSDYSATILGALFQSSRITIWTDVDGVFSADPRKASPDTACSMPHCGEVAETVSCHAASSVCCMTAHSWHAAMLSLCV